MSTIRCIDNISDLVVLLEDAETATARSDDAFRDAVAQILYTPDLDKLPGDPYAREYRNFQLDLYAKIAGKPYTTSSEATTFDFHHECRHPYPYGTRSNTTVGNTLIGCGFLIKQLPLEPDCRVLEVGSGYGVLTAHLAPMGIDLTCIDISDDLLDFVRHRIDRYDHRVTMVNEDIHTFEPEKPFDIVIFYESFHHCHDHVAVLERMKHVVAPTGVIVFAAEPIVDPPNQAVPYPWGLRMDGLSLRCIRRFGWLEIGFTKPYFFGLLDRMGWDWEERALDGFPLCHMIISGPAFIRSGNASPQTKPLSRPQGLRK